LFGFDFRIFWSAAAAVLQGQSPYTIVGFFSPHPLAVLLIPFALLPFELAYFLWTGLKIFLLVKSTDRWGFIKALVFFPVAFDLLQGQMDLLVFILALKLNWIGVVLSTVRPQLAIWILPYTFYRWWQEKKFDQFWKSALGVLALYGTSTLIDPDWWQKWFNAPKIAWEYNQQSASLFGLAKILPFDHLITFVAIGILAILAFFFLRPRTQNAYWQWVALFNPVANIYSLTILFNQVDWIIVVFGLLALPVSQLLHTNAVWALMPLYLILKERFWTKPR
jgi:hypothetical protein